VFFGTVDFPEPLVDAHAAGNLVIFVGAGASMAPPSSLPNFGTLAAQIASESSVTLTDEELLQPDFALGRISSLGVDVHQRVVDLVGNPVSRPNRLHTAIVDLTLTAETLRVVTTNYDRHLSAVLATRGVTVEEFSAPALPMGDNFSGLVYLHGSLHQDPARLVVTDEDFGHAYLVDAWAARFLERMYRSYTVLFIGYSHADMVMTYMARALGPQSERYALTDETHEDARWNQLGITPIRYQVDAGSHQALDVAVERWAEVVGTGLLGHQERIAQLVGGPPPNVPEDVSYMEACLLDLPRTRIFADLAKGFDWLEWVVDRPPFDRLFTESSPDEVSSLLAWWFALRFVAVEEHSTKALSLVMRSGSHLGPALWSAIAHRIQASDPPRPVWMKPWIALLLESALPNGLEMMEFILHGCRFPDDGAVALLLFEYLSAPQVVIQPSFISGAGPRFAVEPRGSQYWLAECWSSVFRPFLSNVANEVMQMMDGHLRRARYFLTSGGDSFDSVSYSRHAIEPHPQDQTVPDAMDVLIDAARDCLEVLLDAGDALGPAMIESWSSSEVPILERLALHGWCYRTDVDADEKIRRLTSEGWAFKVYLHHEAFRLIALALGQASIAVGDAFIASVENGSPNYG
jgi:hypothetical protein